MINNITNEIYPFRHNVSVRITVMIIQDHDSGHDRRCHHEHNTVEISTYKFHKNNKTKSINCRRNGNLSFK